MINLGETNTIKQSWKEYKVGFFNPKKSRTFQSVLVRIVSWLLLSPPVVESEREAHMGISPAQPHFLDFKVLNTGMDM